MKKSFLLLLIVAFAYSLHAGETTGKDQEWTIAGWAGVTNNGISLIPNFSLGEPAVQFNLSLGRERLSFETDFNFSWEGKPWYILYWLRYQMITAERFQMSTATHLGINFRPSEVIVGSRPETMLTSERYWVAELFPRYHISKKVTAGIFYLFSIGLDPGTAATTHFVTLNTSFSDLKLFQDYYLNINPQVYYLKQETLDGVYFTSSFTLGKHDLPFTLSTLFNQVVSTRIAGNGDFVWNLSLRYSW